MHLKNPIPGGHKNQSRLQHEPCSTRSRTPREQPRQSVSCCFDWTITEKLGPTAFHRPLGTPR